MCINQGSVEVIAQLISVYYPSWYTGELRHNLPTWKDIHLLNLLLALIQSTSPPDINWENILITLLGVGGVVVTVITLLGQYFLNKQKTENEAHLKNVEEVNRRAALRTTEALANAAAERQQDSDLSAAMLQLTKTTGQLSITLAKMGDTQKQNSDILDALSARGAAQFEQAGQERAKLMSGLAVDVFNARTDIEAHRRESKEWVDTLRNDIEDLKEDFDVQIAEILTRLKSAPTAESQQEATRQVVEAITALKMEIEKLCQRVNAEPTAQALPTPPPS